MYVYTIESLKNEKENGNIVGISIAPGQVGNDSTHRHFHLRKGTNAKADRLDGWRGGPFDPCRAYVGY
jgi:hypothetical protein